VYYQLPNGKTIWLDISDILSLTQEDIQYLISINSGEYITSPFKHSALDEKEEEDSNYVDDLDDDVNDNPNYYYKQFFPDEFYDDSDDINLDDLDEN
jgi:hypothetical protein